MMYNNKFVGEVTILMGFGGQCQPPMMLSQTNENVTV